MFRPGATHGIDNGPDSRMYCLELMVPNEVRNLGAEKWGRAVLQQECMCKKAAELACSRSGMRKQLAPAAAVL